MTTAASAAAAGGLEGFRADHGKQRKDTRLHHDLRFWHGRVSIRFACPPLTSKPPFRLFPNEPKATDTWGKKKAGKPTSSTSEQTVSMAEGSYPWESGTSGKYQYHPGGDRTKAPKDAPSALHSVVVPNVTLPKVSLCSFLF